MDFVATGTHMETCYAEWLKQGGGELRLSGCSTSLAVHTPIVCDISSKLIHGSQTGNCMMALCSSLQN
ncbi:hypothetical protein DUNSADRAFT_2401 [Dunaliella salina]|uniref:Encoded protein n=1 Tax=Dunaliella salina TaxID=3046 RepID=A0ABQ7FWF1_DUNSA|nr:hypothetical protein DUNSADRAFT_2401 [Dunaliella salina]|eukprot:KAF5826672.1 hypothetical protein DUNSADRAFT_2401 [Dunaliella salina]